MRRMLVVAGVVLMAFGAWRLGLFDAASGHAPAPVRTAATPDAAAPTPAPPASQTATGMSTPEPTPATGSSPAPQAPSAPPHAQPVYGSPFEASLLTNGFVNGTAERWLHAEDFDRFADALDAQNAGRANALAGKYREQLDATLAASGQPYQIDRFACGSNVCIASILVPAPGEWFPEWLLRFPDSTTLPIRALQGHTRPRPGGVTERRLLFTTHPGPSGFIVSPRRR